MKEKKKNPKHDLETIMPLLIDQWRKFLGVGGPRDVLQTREFRSVVKAVEQLENIFYGKEIPQENYFSQPELLGAYLLYYWVMHYQEALSLISELPRPPQRVLDICSGPAAYSFAALQFGASEVIATDKNMDALTLGAEVCGRYGKTISIRKWDCLREAIPVKNKFDLIILSHGLRELFPENEKGWKTRQDEFIRSLFNYLTEDGFLLIVENSFLPGNQRLLEVRDFLVKEGVPVQAPCVWQGECPALKSKNSPCYAQRDFERPYLIKEIQRAARIKLSSLKMSYLILRHPNAQWPRLPEKALYRVTSPALETVEGNAYYLCGSGGKKRLLSSINTHEKDSRAFEYLKRGELISVENANEQRNQLYVVEGTTIKVEAALGKSLEDCNFNE